MFPRDFSVGGVGFVSPCQLFPNERVELDLGLDEELELIVRRCRRLAAEAFVCGTVFATGPMSARQCREFADAVASVSRSV